MTENLKKLLESSQILSPDSISEITKLFEEQVAVKAEALAAAKLAEQDELYGNKLQTLVESIDENYSSKLQKVLEHVDADRTKKLEKVIKHYESDVNKQVSAKYRTLLEGVSAYLDVVLEEKIPTAELKTAVNNRKAVKILESLKHTLAVDNASSIAAIKPALAEGAKTINESVSKVALLEEQLQKITAEHNKLQGAILLEQKLASVSPQKKKYIKQAFAGKDVSYITENFDFTSKLFDKNEEKLIQELKESAPAKSDGVELVVESTEHDIEDPMSVYMDAFTEEK